MAMEMKKKKAEEDKLRLGLKSNYKFWLENVYFNFDSAVFQVFDDEWWINWDNYVQKCNDYYFTTIIYILTNNQIKEKCHIL